MLFFNLCQSSPSLTILVPLCFVIISLVFFYLCKVLFSGFLQFNNNFADALNNSKYCDRAPLNLENCLLYLSSTITQFFDFIRCMVFDFILHCVTMHTLYTCSIIYCTIEAIAFSALLHAEDCYFVIQLFWPVLVMLQITCTCPGSADSGKDK